MKRLLASAASIALAVGLLTVNAGSAQAATTKYKGDTFTYVAVKGGVEITKVKTSDGKVTFPKSIKGKPVLHIQLTLNRTLSTIDLSKATKLRTVAIGSNSKKTWKLNGLAKLKQLHHLGLSGRVKSLSLTKNAKLKTLYLGKNNLASLNLKKNKALTELTVTQMPKLTKLSTASNPALRILTLDRTKVSALSLTANPRLVTLNLINVPLKSLNLQQNRNLQSLWIQDVRLTALDLTGNPKLSYLWAKGTRLTQLDLSRNPLLDMPETYNSVDPTVLLLWD